jgi:hypothetical protein
VCGKCHLEREKDPPAISLQEADLLDMCGMLRQRQKIIKSIDVRQMQEADLLDMCGMLRQRQKIIKKNVGIVLNKL